MAAPMDVSAPATATGSGMPNDALYRELWHACAGPLVTVPRQGERVYYFPQGHMEQLEASTHEELDQYLPMFNLPSKVLCRVVNVELRAEAESDEVYAQIMLQPEDDLGPKAEDVSKTANTITFPFRFLLGMLCAIYYGSFLPVYMWIKDKIVPTGMPI